jgi:hypothetical protein
VTLQERFSPERLIATACDEAGSDDFGDDGWQPGLDRVTDGLINEARLSAIGVEIAYLDIMRALKNRLGVIAWRKQHPEIASEPITQPIVIVGQPRTGTTILYDLLAQDPDLRAPLTWEVDAPCPVPQPETYHSDPRRRRPASNSPSRSFPASWHFTRWALSSDRSASASRPVSSPA